jgi:creatinine amidohydrolase
METRWLYVTSDEFSKLREAAKGVCVLPMGCVEKHGYHLPLGVDVFEAEGLAYQASQIETVCVFPTFIFGDVPENYPTMPAGSVTLPMDTEFLLLEQLCDQIARNGFKKIIIFNSHGGNRGLLSVFLRKLENKPHDYVVVVVHIMSDIAGRIGKCIEEEGRERFPYMTDSDVETVLMYHKEKKKSSGHAVFGETAYTFGIHPETVKMERMGTIDGTPLKLSQKFKDAGIDIRDGGFFVNCPHCISGPEPTDVTEGIGKAAVEVEAERIANAYKVIKEDEDLIRWHNENWKTNI